MKNSRNYSAPVFSNVTVMIIRNMCFFYSSGSWLVEEQRGNFTVWRYRVRWACGARCTGEAHVAAEARAQAPSHAHALRHLVTLHVRTCTGGLLPWSDTCGECQLRLLKGRALESLMSCMTVRFWSTMTRRR